VVHRILLLYSTESPEAWMFGGRGHRLAPAAKKLKLPHDQ
jgi:hypothetical protein